MQIRILAGFIKYVPHGSIVRPDLFKLFFTSVHIFADDYSLSNIAPTVDSLKPTLESECKAAIKWFDFNRIILNPAKFKATILDKCKSNNSEVKFVIDSEQIQAL